MAKKRPQTISEYIKAAPAKGQPHLKKLYAILKSVAPKAEEKIKWGMPFFIEPRFLYAFAGFKNHMSFTPMPSGLDPFRKELQSYETSKAMLKIPYNKPIPAGLIRKIARRRVKSVKQSKGKGFW